MQYPVTTLLSLILSSILLLALFPTSATAVPAFESGWHLLNITHIPVRSTGPDICNGSISFTLAKGNKFASRVCSHTFIASTGEQASGGPFACSDDWQDLTYYWREDNGDDAEEEQLTGIAAATEGKRSNVVLDIWFAYLDCRYVDLSPPTLKFPLSSLRERQNGEELLQKRDNNGRATPRTVTINWE